MMPSGTRGGPVKLVLLLTVLRILIQLLEIRGKGAPILRVPSSPDIDAA
eukprot:CAMPEP_0119117296 /NCGR_PEP_ID=MMETSP1180-20130426/52758_1 /TAXON_ID=3052 ORGANISM="Chlamydomonas cf sp, Strain CCMP681" /NCGR_SAMPLE_ID=MMETSP1180 /ASSEMBLY_ACC=CAM_ASM_000741 /LENGTH=48 /DNA_ID= /DNA_START= /DNA_END= /DNA_ORIENTATION=